jgi:hypothetical protein
MYFPDVGFDRHAISAANSVSIVTRWALAGGAGQRAKLDSESAAFKKG